MTNDSVATEHPLPGAEKGSHPVDARGASWRNKDLGNANLSHAKLCRIDLRGANLSNAEIEGADLRLAKFDNNTRWPIEFRFESCGAVGPGARLNGQFFNGADLRGMDLTGASFLGAYLSGADLSGSVLDDVSFVGADLRNTSFKGARCKRTRFGTSQLDLADFRGADLEDADFSNTESIKGADFSYCKNFEKTKNCLLERSSEQLDYWNPITRQNTRNSLETR